jgi:hypothetical protein
VSEQKEPPPVRLMAQAVCCVLFASLVVGASVLWVVSLVDPETRRAMGGKS